MLLIPFNREICAGAALVCYAAAFVLTPSSVRSQITIPMSGAPHALPNLAPPVTAVRPQRDPFAPRAHVDDDVQSDLPSRPSQLVPVPRELAPHGGDTVHVTAIATGIQASAIVEVGGMSRVVVTGDALDGSRIQTIDHNTVELDNGKRFVLASNPTPQ